MNLPSALKLPHVVDEEISSKLAANRMSGPFSITQAHTIFGSHFCMSPLSLVEKDPGSSKWCTICHLLKEDDNGQLTNGWLNADDFPMKYYLVNMTADFVCGSHDTCPSLWPPMTCLYLHIDLTCHDPPSLTYHCLNLCLYLPMT